MEGNDFKKGMQDYFRNLRGEVTDIALGNLEPEKGYWQLIKKIDEAENFFNERYGSGIETEERLLEFQIEADKENPRKGQLLNELKREIDGGKSETKALDIIAKRYSLDYHQKGGLISQPRRAEKTGGGKYEEMFYQESEVIDKLGIGSDALEILSEHLVLNDGELQYYADFVDKIANFNLDPSEFKGTEAYSGKQLREGLGLSKELIISLSRKRIIHRLGKEGNTTYYAADSFNKLIGRGSRRNKGNYTDAEIKQNIETGEMINITQAALDFREKIKRTSLCEKDLDECTRILIKHSERGHVMIYSVGDDKYMPRQGFDNLLRVELAQYQLKKMLTRHEKTISDKELSEILEVRTHIIRDLVRDGSLKKDGMSNRISIKSLQKYLSSYPDLTEQPISL
jgi:hypothetical protein